MLFSLCPIWSHFQLFSLFQENIMNKQNACIQGKQSYLDKCKIKNDHITSKQRFDSKQRFLWKRKIKTITMGSKFCWLLWMFGITYNREQWTILSLECFQHFPTLSAIRNVLADHQCISINHGSCWKMNNCSHSRNIACPFTEDFQRIFNNKPVFIPSCQSRFFLL